MPIMIDGHNLIPKVAGINLGDLDDEMRLVEMLQEYSRLRRRGQVECFFDQAPAGHPRKRKFGSVSVQFAKQGKTADGEIEARLKGLGRQARNWIVVSSDQRVRQAAREAGARDIRAEEFAADLQETLKQRNKESESQGEVQIDSQEVDYWLELFRGSKPKNQEH